MAPLKKSTIFLGVLILAFFGAAVKFLMLSKKESAPEGEAREMMTPSVSTMTPNPVNEERGMTPKTVSALKEVTVKTSYSNPAGLDDVAFTLMVDGDGAIVDAKIEVLAVHEISKKRQMAFAAELPQVLKGKKLSELTSIDRVGGSSLTTKSFNESLAQMKAQLSM